MTRAWVTGAAGFIGQHLVRHLAASGAHVAGLDLTPQPGALYELVDSWQKGAVNKTALDELCKATGIPETIYHLAGGSSVGPSFADPIGDFDATVTGTIQVLNWVRQCAPQCRLVLVSSAAVYGNLYKGPIAETAQTSPYSPYGTHKFVMEQVARGWAKSFGLRVAALRLFSVYGPGLKKQLLWDLCNKLAQGGKQVTLGGTGAELRDWTHVEDVVRVMTVIPALADSTMPTVNVGTGIGTSVARIAELTARAFGRTAEDIFFIGQSRLGDPFSLISALGKLEDLGFKWSWELEDGIREYVDWYCRECRT